MHLLLIFDVKFDALLVFHWCLHTCPLTIQLDAFCDKSIAIQSQTMSDHESLAILSQTVSDRESLAILSEAVNADMYQFHVSRFLVLVLCHCL